MASSSKRKRAKSVSEGGNLQISAIVCTYSNASLLRRTLDSLIKQTLPPQEYEIIVVDNNSTDNTREVIRDFQERGPHQIHYVLETTQGLSAARNTGIQHSSGPIISFIDDDAEAAPQWLAAVVEAFRQNPDAWGVGGNTFAIWDAKRPAWLKDDFLGDLSTQDRGPDKLKLTLGENILGANCSFRREVFTEIGYFSTDLGRMGKNLLAGEEAELCQRIHLQGKSIYHIPDVVVFHHVMPERMTRSYFNRRLYFSGISRAFYLSRTYGTTFASHEQREWWQRFVLRILSDGRRCLTLKRPKHTLFRHWTWFRFCVGYTRGLRHIRIREPWQDSYWLVHNPRAKEVASTFTNTMRSKHRSLYRLLVDYLNTHFPIIITLGRFGRWSLTTLKNISFGIGCIALLIIVGLSIAGALIEPLRWYLVGTASGLSLLWGGLLVLSYARLILNHIISDQRAQVSDIKEKISDIKKSLSASKAMLAELNKEISNNKNILAKMNVGNFTLFQQFNRRLTNEDLKRFSVEWAPTLGLNLDARALAYIAHHICLAEDTCIGRLAGNIETMLLRVLVARGVKAPKLEVLEIGTLFGVGVAMIYDNCREFFNNVHITVIDPLSGYYGSDNLDVMTKMPVTRDIFVHNMQRMNIPKADYTIIEKLSTEDEAIEQASKRRYNVLIIDGDHSYSGVKHDFYNYRHLVKQGGYIIFDDYGNPSWPGLTDFVDKEVVGMPGLEFVGTDVRTAVFRVIAPQDLTRQSATTVTTVTTKDESSTGAPSPALTGRDTAPSQSFDYPKHVAFETSTTCNAHCDFCPQSKLVRHGHIMEMELIEKIISELSEIPSSCSPEIAPNGVNEPLADKRIFDVLNLISGKLPNAKIYFVTNGNLLSRKAIAELSKYNLSKVNISLNFCDKKTYERRMGLQWEKTLAAMSMLHEKAASGEFRHPVYISRVQDESEYDIVFANWVEANYPAFGYWPKIAGDWLGSVPNLSRRSSGVKSKCPQWYFMHIASTGAVRRCCMDADVQYPWGNVKTMNLLDIFNQGEWTDLRQGQKSRFEVHPCNKCTYLF